MPFSCMPITCLHFSAWQEITYKGSEYGLYSISSISKWILPHLHLYIFILSEENTCDFTA